VLYTWRHTGSITYYSLSTHTLSCGLIDDHTTSAFLCECHTRADGVVVVNVDIRWSALSTVLRSSFTVASTLLLLRSMNREFLFFQLGITDSLQPGYQTQPSLNFNLNFKLIFRYILYIRICVPPWCTFSSNFRSVSVIFKVCDLSS